MFFANLETMEWLSLRTVVQQADDRHGVRWAWAVVEALKEICFVRKERRRVEAFDSWVERRHSDQRHVLLQDRVYAEIIGQALTPNKTRRERGKLNASLRVRAEYESLKSEYEREVPLCTVISPLRETEHAGDAALARVLVKRAVRRAEQSLS